MEKTFDLGSRVVLKTFLGKNKPPRNTPNSENFWVLIGLKGVIFSNEKKLHPAYPKRGKRVLVRFDEDILEYGLHCHNELDNCLWLFIDDLDITDTTVRRINP